MIPRVLLAVAAAVAVAGCGSGSVDAPSRVALGFAQAVSAHDGQQACSLIAPATRAQLESDGHPCSEAILTQDVPDSTSVRDAQQYGLESRVILDKDVVFVSRFSIGWRVVAAVCKDRGEKLPYDCQIAGE